jgi:hypothetical protein
MCGTANRSANYCTRIGCDSQAQVTAIGAVLPGIAGRYAAGVQTISDKKRACNTQWPGYNLVSSVELFLYSDFLKEWDL